MKEDWIEVLVRDYYDLVYKRLLSSLRGDKDVAEDLAQEVFLSAHKGRNKFRGDCKPSSWLYKITSNVFLLHLRKEKQGVSGRMDVRELSTVNASEYLLPTAYQMHDPVNWKQFDKNLDRMEIQIMELLYQGYANKEIALILGKSVPSIKSKINRLRLKLKHPRKFTPIKLVPKLPEEPPKVPKIVKPPMPTIGYEKAGTLEALWNYFGGTTNAKGYRELNPKVGSTKSI